MFTINRAFAETMLKGLVELKEGRYVPVSKIEIIDDQGETYKVPSETLKNLFDSYAGDINNLASSRAHKLIPATELQTKMKEDGHDYIIDGIEFLLQNKKLEDYKKVRAA